MRIHLLSLPLVAVIGGVVGAVSGFTAQASPPSTASFTAVDYHWDASTGGTSVSIAVGGTVSFSYPSGHSMHNVDFAQGPQPSSCELNGSPHAPPIPSAPTGPGWSGSCTFNTPGTYTFRCDMHPFMTGTVIVTSTTTTTTTTTTSTTATATAPPTTTSATGTTTAASTTTNATTPSQPPSTSGPYPPTYTTGYPPSPIVSTPASGGAPSATAASPLALAARLAIRVAERQRGNHVTGSIDVSRSGRGGRALILLRIRSDGRLVEIGHLRLRLQRPGRVPFTVSLNHAATRILDHAEHLDITAAITVAGPAGPAVSADRQVRLRP